MGAVSCMLVSIHIPKTGETTLRESVLKPALGDRLKMDYGDKPLATEVSVRNEFALAFEPAPDLANRYDCIHGHFLATKYLSNNFPCQFAVWFRDPVQRMVSRYFDGKRTEGSLVTPGMSLAEFCEIKKFHNTYASYLWNFSLDRLDFVGIVEDYDHSLAVFCRRFGIRAPQTLQPRNENPSKASTHRYEVSAELAALIRRQNSEDVEIYDQALAIHQRDKKEELGLPSWRGEGAESD